MLNPTPPERLVDTEGHPYFLWDSRMTLSEFRAGLRDPDPAVRAYLMGKLMRQAKPDDVFTFVSAREIRDLWPLLERYLGKTREFWTWLFEAWEARVAGLGEADAEDLEKFKEHLISVLLESGAPSE